MKKILKGKTIKRPYTGPKRWYKSCRNHGGCPYCENGRLHSSKRRRPVEDEDVSDNIQEQDTLDPTTTL